MTTRASHRTVLAGLECVHDHIGLECVHDHLGLECVHDQTSHRTVLVSDHRPGMCT